MSILKSVTFVVCCAALTVSTAQMPGREGVRAPETKAAGALPQASTQAQQIIAEAEKPSTIGQNLQTLTDEIGGRVPGTAAMDKAVQWGVDAFRAAGADEVHTEQFQIPQFWAEGPTQMEVTAPVRFPVRLVSMAWTPPLPQRTATIVDVGDGKSQDFAKAGDLAGKIVLVHTDVLKTWDDLFAEYMNAPPVIQQAAEAKALAIAFMASREHDILYRHINSQTGRIDRLPMVILAREDGERIARILATGKPVQVSLSIPNRVSGAIMTSNVVAELRGSEKQDEYVVLGAHLDSWELGTGALDNGCNAALVIDALRTIKAAGARPRRSIRFILFSGEEQGMLGSLAYVRQHQAELDRVAGAVIFDEGTGKVSGFSLGGREDIQPEVAKVVSPLAQWNATQLTTDAMWGTDHFDFMLEGVPTMVANQEAANYLVNYHATSDTYDKVDIPELKRHVAIAAAVAFGIADDPQPLGHARSVQKLNKC